jgi:Spy/CpxP family protein refolding chaperone
MNTRTILAVGLLGAGLAISFSPRTHAQNAATPPPSGDTTAPRRLRLNPTPGTRPLADELNLTTEQRPKFDAEMRDFQDKMRALQEDHDKKIAAILTPEQADRYRTLQAQMRGGQGRRGFGGGPNGNRAGNRGGGGGFGNPQAMVQRMKTDLNLSADQESQITKIYQDSQAKTQALRTQNLDRDAMRTQMQALRQDRTDKINAVLTPEQRAKYQTMMQNFRGGGRGNRGGNRGNVN